MKKILITTSSFGKYDSSVLDTITSAGYLPVLNPHGRKLTEDEVQFLLDEHLPEALIAGVEPLTREIIASVSGLKTIARCGIGMDSVDIDAAEEYGISVTNTPDAPTRAVAELVIGQVLCLLRGLNSTDSALRANRWERPFGSLLHGKKIGIIGCGRIGKMTADLFHAFGCHVFGSDPVCVLDWPHTMMETEELAMECDIISVHTPYLSTTHHLINEKMIRKMKKGSILVNCSRGGLVDEEALCSALKDGHLRGAVLDTFEEEPYCGPLIKFKNTVLSAHIGSYAKESRVTMEKEAVFNALKSLGVMVEA